MEQVTAAEHPSHPQQVVSEARISRQSTTLVLLIKLQQYMRK